jgi:glycosyltransferase involved in cell wall biosynthesis
MATSGSPEISIVIPTYNRRELLHQSLLRLAEQRPRTPEFEVVVSDDGSSDDSKSVAESFTSRLRLKYHFQEDLGNRVALARNAGARLASAPILAFLDSGALPASDFVWQHLAAHADPANRSAVTGYAYGYNPDEPMPGLADILGQYTPEEAVRRYGTDPAFLDVRERMLSLCNDDLSQQTLPWKEFWTINCSLRADDFWAVGGFDEGHRGWAVEDIDLAYRLYRYGLPIRFQRAAWVIESPLRRERTREVSEEKANMSRFLARHPDPAVEIGWAVIHERPSWPWRFEYNNFLRYRDEVRDLTVTGEIERALGAELNGESMSSVAIIGVGAAAPDLPNLAILIDFDEKLLASATRDGRHAGHHAIGLRTPVGDQSVDVVVITSRLAGLWDRWGDLIMQEAHRIGRDVRCCV